jgi:hypothetical protein
MRSRSQQKSLLSGIFVVPLLEAGSSPEALALHPKSVSGYPLGSASDLNAKFTHPFEIKEANKRLEDVDVLWSGYKVSE